LSQAEIPSPRRLPLCLRWLLPCASSPRPRSALFRQGLTELSSFINLSICRQALHTAHKFDEKLLPRQVVYFVAIQEGLPQGHGSHPREDHQAAARRLPHWPNSCPQLPPTPLPLPGCVRSQSAVSSSSVIKLRFGLGLATSSLLPNLPAACHCDSELTPEHLISCKNAHDKLLRHNLVVGSFLSLAAHHGVPSTNMSLATTTTTARSCKGQMLCSSSL
jgi:hypothetical protein